MLLYPKINSQWPRKVTWSSEIVIDNVGAISASTESTVLIILFIKLCDVSCNVYACLWVFYWTQVIQLSPLINALESFVPIKYLTVASIRKNKRYKYYPHTYDELLNEKLLIGKLIAKNGMLPSIILEVKLQLLKHFCLNMGNPENLMLSTILT